MTRQTLAAASLSRHRFLAGSVFAGAALLGCDTSATVHERRRWMPHRHNGYHMDVVVATTLNNTS